MSEKTMFTVQRKGVITWLELDISPDIPPKISLVWRKFTSRGNFLTVAQRKTFSPTISRRLSLAISVSAKMIWRLIGTCGS